MLPVIALAALLSSAGDADARVAPRDPWVPDMWDLALALRTVPGGVGATGEVGFAPRVAWQNLGATGRVAWDIDVALWVIGGDASAGLVRVTRASVALEPRVIAALRSESAQSALSIYAALGVLTGGGVRVLGVGAATSTAPIAVCSGRSALGAAWSVGSANGRVELVGGIGAQGPELQTTLAIGFDLDAR